MTLKIEFEKPMFFSALPGTPGAFFVHLDIIAFLYLIVMLGR